MEAVLTLCRTEVLGVDGRIQDAVAQPVAVPVYTQTVSVWAAATANTVFHVAYRTCSLQLQWSLFWVEWEYLPLFAHKEQDGDEADDEEGHSDGEDDDQVVEDAVISCKRKTQGCYRATKQPLSQTGSSVSTILLI